MTQAPRPSRPLPADPLRAADADVRRRISAYPGTLTYLDLIRRNKRQSALLVAAMILLGVLLGAAIAVLVVARAGGRIGTDDLVASALLGAGVALVLSILASVWSWFGGSSAILMLAGAREISKPADPELFNVVEEIAIAGGLPMPRIFLLGDSAMNAFATGRDPKHAAVAITVGLRQKLTRDELQGVMAHEMAHVRHLDIRFSMLMATMVGLIVFLCDAFFRIAFRSMWGGRRWDSGKSRGESGHPIVAIAFIVLALVLAIVAPLLALFIQMAYSRQREFLADVGAVELTRNPLGLASALQKLAEDPDPLVDVANRGTAHLYIVNPLRKMRESGQQLNSLFSSHPPVKERIARLLALAR